MKAPSLSALGLTLIAFLLVLQSGIAPLPAQANQPPVAYEQRGDNVELIGQLGGDTDAVAAKAAGESRVFLPFVMRNIPSGDLSILSMDVTQTVQDPSNSVPLVANRPTVLRIYGKTTSADPMGAISLSLAAYRDGQPLPGSPLKVGPWAVFPSPSRGLYETSFNVQLPSEWLSGSVVFAATLDPDNAIAEGDESNNTATGVLTFNPVPPLDIKIVPINYTHTPTGKHFPGPTQDTISDYIRRMYPVSTVNVSVRAPMAYSGNLENGSTWGDLLNQVTGLKYADGAPSSQVYYGFIPTTNAAGESYPRAWAGMGWIGQRASIGLYENEGQTAAHELGHNFGIRHAPCGNAGVPDPNYPYAGGIIGQYGLDVSRERLWDPNTPDIMSYCSPKWISDYNYRALYEDQRRHATALSPATMTEMTDSLLVRATFDQSGEASLLPIYAFSGRPTETPAASDYTVELRDETDKVMATHKVAFFEAEEDGIEAQGIFAVLPRPSRPVAIVRLLRSGALLAERTLSQNSPVVAMPQIEQGPEVTALRWSSPATPALVRYTADDGKSWTTLGIDVAGGQIRFDPATFPTGNGRFEISPADIASP